MATTQRASTRPRTTRVWQRGTALKRTLLVLGALSRGSWTVADLARHLGIHWRTLYRDIETLRQVGVTVEENAYGLYHASRDSIWRVLGV